MASTRRLARTAMVLACSVALVVPGTAAFAAPPDHAPAHGRSQQESEPSRSTAVATTGEQVGDDDHPGRGRGRDAAPGQVRKRDAATREPTSIDADVQGGGPGRAPAPRPGRDLEPTVPHQPDAPTLVVEPAGAGDGEPAPAPVPPPSAPVPPTPAAPAPIAAAPVLTEATPDVAPPPTAELPTVGRRVVRLDLDRPFRELLHDVTTTIGRAVPRDLGPVREPLAEVVPLLLALLGAFLALQRGLGRGLGQLPMVAVAPRHDVVRHAR